MVGGAALEVPRFFCDACRSLDLEIVGGKELYLDSIEIIEREPGGGA